MFRAPVWSAVGCFVLLWAPFLSGAETSVPSELRDYVTKPDASFAWEVVDRQKSEAGKVIQVRLTSQTWQGIVWKHSLSVCEPVRLEHPRHVLLCVSGGSNSDPPRPRDLAMGMALAKNTGARVAVLGQVPNQPLFDGRTEDDLITETWLRYLKGGDSSWPLLFPMVKSAVRAMDAVQELAKTEWQGTTEGFVITGGSKRGWTSWLSAAVDSRLIATAPMVIDVLNFRPQMDHQLATWGAYSEQIADYSSKGLIKPGEENDRERHLREMMDPYTYRSDIKIPKLLIHGTNDEYWCVDATKFYWDDLVGDKYVLKLPNDGHGLEQGRDLAFSTLGVFFRHVVTRTALPELKWRQSHEGGTHRLVVTSAASPTAARLWSAQSTSKDFRQSEWTSQPMPVGDGGFTGSFGHPKTGHVAYFGELQFESSDLPYSLTTLVFWK